MLYLFKKIMVFIDNHLLTAKEAFDKLDLGKSVLLNYSVQHVRNERQKIKSHTVKKFRVSTDKETKKPILTRIA